MRFVMRLTRLDGSTRSRSARRFDRVLRLPGVNWSGGLLAVALALALAEPAFADGGALLALREEHGVRAALFISSPSPRVGPADVSVLVQDDRGAMLDDCRARIGLIPEGQPHLRREYEATSAAATNKLFRAARVEFDTRGGWIIEAEVTANGKTLLVRQRVEVGDSRQGARAYAGWIAWPFVVLAFAALRERLLANEHRQRFDTRRTDPTT